MELYKPPVLRRVAHQIVKKNLFESNNAQCYTDDTSAALGLGINEEITSQTHEETNIQIIVPKFEDIIDELSNLLDTDSTKLGDFLSARIVPFNKLAQDVGEFLVKHAIEDCGGQKQIKRGIVAQAFIALASTTVAAAFCHGVVRSLQRYFDCRMELRKNEEYFPIWLNFIAVTYEFGQIAQEDNVMQLVFNTLEYLFAEPIVNTLRIIELECSLSTLMIVGRRLEQEYPAQMSALRELIRDAFLVVSEGWTRKMLMLMVELAAVEWRMLPEQEEYYFR